MCARAGRAVPSCTAEIVEVGTAVRWHETCHCRGAAPCADWLDVSMRALRPMDGWAVELHEPDGAEAAGRHLRGYRSAQLFVARYAGDPVTLTMFPTEGPHRQIAMTIYLAEGSARVVGDGGAADLHPGDLVVVPPDGICTIRFGEASRVLFIGVPHPEPDLVRPGLHRLVPLADAGRALADALIEPPVQPFDVAAAAWAEGALRDLVMGVMAVDAAPADLRGGVRARARAYVDVHIADPTLSAPDVARALGMSVRSLHEAFEGTDETVARIVRARRVVAAKVLLTARPNLNLAGVARRCGFGGPDQFRRVFRAEAGLLPGEYRAGTLAL
ncbi:helix-turn-helix transcriptional regulator [Occultella gossypii]|uniref:Helix-turn-helix domain-containing protein n=1 Tax=Occultella gossypii TaxID=2800820 RepID=A0ABS7SCU9_9MICO|nr:AraC family transcriptional regulator [Occultella gossypii]MBZ2197078.1 helix-turn-helix domain-containing protein [Occultella gossypii]